MLSLPASLLPLLHNQRRAASRDTRDCCSGARNMCFRHGPGCCLCDEHQHSTSCVALQFEIPFNSPLVAPAPGATQYTPDQVHVTLGGESLTSSCPYSTKLPA